MAKEARRVVQEQAVLVDPRLDRGMLLDLRDREMPVLRGRMLLLDQTLDR